MMKHLFDTLNDLLDEIIRQYPQASQMKKQQLDQQLVVLKEVNDRVLEEWVRFEEKISGFFGEQPQEPVLMDSVAPEEFPGVDRPTLDRFRRGQGYYRLFMFEEAIREFDGLLERHPDFLMARLYLSLCYMQCGERAEAYRNLQFVTALSDEPQIQAISYNAMGCIQFKFDNLEKACEYFRMAAESDPRMPEPQQNLHACLAVKQGGRPGSVLPAEWES